MLLKELFESDTKHVTFCFGRMNPPTIGHGQVFETMAAQGGEMKIFLSQSQDSKKNPLDYSTKIKFVKAMFPQYAKDIVEDSSLNTVVKVASYLHEQGYNAATFVAGSDRLEDMKKLLNQYNGVEGKAHGYYNFDVIDYASSGEREDGAEGVAGISASGARAAAANNDFEAFQEATGAGELAKKLYDAVRAGMGVKESIHFETAAKDKLHQYHQTLRKKSGLPNPQYYKDLQKTFDLPDDERRIKTAELKKKYNVEDVEEGWKSKLAGAALAGATALGGGAAQAGDLEKSIGPLPIMATIQIKLPDGQTKTIKKDLGHAYDYKLDDAKKDLENILDKKGIKQYTIHLDRYNSNDAYLDKDAIKGKSKDKDYSAKSNYIDNSPYQPKDSKTDYMDKTPYTAKHSSASYMDRSKEKEFRDMGNY